MPSHVSPNAILTLLLQTRELLSRMFRGALREYPLTECQWRTLQILLGSGPISVGQLSQACRHSAPNTVRILNQLQRVGLVSRTRPPKNKRVMIVSLSENGIALAAMRVPGIAACSLTLRNLFGPEQLNELLALLEMLDSQCDRRARL